MPEQRVVLVSHAREIEVRYRALRDGRFRFGDGAEARIHAWSPAAIDAEIDGRRARARIARAGDRLVIQGPQGGLELELKPRFEVPGAALIAGGFVAPMPGKVIELRVRVGDRVRSGETLVVLEAMKMEHPMRATEDGTVSEVRVSQGDQVEAGAVLLVVEADAREGES
jgi:propionyl-CoA carboxylase alpha chain